MSIDTVRSNPSSSTQGIYIYVLDILLLAFTNLSLFVFSFCSIYQFPFCTSFYLKFPCGRVLCINGCFIHIFELLLMSFHIIVFKVFFTFCIILFLIQILWTIKPFIKTVFNDYVLYKKWLIIVAPGLTFAVITSWPWTYFEPTPILTNASYSRPKKKRKLDTWSPVTLRSSHLGSEMKTLLKRYFDSSFKLWV